MEKRREMEAETEILEPLELHYSDLLLLSSSPSVLSSSSPQELERLESISSAVMKTLGPSGPGLLSITGIPKAAGLRQYLLPLAQKLALLSNKDRLRVLQEHSLGSDVPLKNPDRSVSSFALQLKYAQDPSMEFSSSGQNHKDEDSHIANENPIVDRSNEFQYDEFKELRDTFKELGLCMMGVGLRLAQICDKAIGGRELEQNIMDSCTAKGRLIHYHSILDNKILKEAKTRRKGFPEELATVSPSLSNGSTTSGSKFLPNASRTQDEPTPSEHLHKQSVAMGSRCCRTYFSNLWQQWHYDYGIFTVLTTPMFISSCVSSSEGCSSPDGHTYLQLFDTDKNKIFVVKSPPESFIIQVGESADILSRGKLRSTLHSVGRPVELENLSRETFVVFLQPAWGKVFSFSEYPLINEVRSQENVRSSNGIPDSKNSGFNALDFVTVGSQVSHQLKQDILGKVPPLTSRLKDGMTFAEFSRKTTKQYYGGQGTQSRR